MIEIFLYSFLTNFFYYCLGCLILSRNNITNYSLFYKALIGVITGSFIALLLNFFTPLSKNINSFLFILVILIFLLKLHITIKKKEIIFLIISTLLSFFLILYSNINRPDAGLYHLPFIGILNEYKIIFGLNNLHFRFGHVSIIQYLSALNNNYFFKEEGIIIPLASIASFYYIYFLNEVFKIYKKETKINSSSLFSLLVLIYISFKIMGYDGFGNDAIAHLSFFYLISYVFKLEKKSIDVTHVFLISVFIFLNKSTMAFTFIISIFIMFYKYKLDLKKIFILTFSFPAIFLFLWLIKNLITSGCAIYPVVITCVDYLPWLNILSTSADNIASEAWSKAWPENDNQKLAMEIFIKDFNWVTAWSKKHLIYILNIIIPYTLALLALLLFLKINSKKFNNKIILIKLPKFYWLVFFSCFIGNIFFFIKFPIYRYGYSYLISLIILIFIYFIRKNTSQKKVICISKFVFSLAIIVFISKQSLRIIKNFDLNYINKPWPRIYSFANNEKINSQKQYINNSFFYYFSKNGECMFSPPPCTNYEIDKKLIAKQLLGYTFLTYR
jgi:hypothetical protein